MDKYIIESVHEAKDCINILKLILAQGYLTHYEWGCKDGVHIGWAVVEAESREEALMTVPSLIRNKARAVKLNKFSDEEVQSLHNEQDD